VLSISCPLDQVGERFGREATAGTIGPQESTARLPKSARLKLCSRSAATRSRKPMRKVVFKALTAVSIIGRGSKKHVDWTLTIAIFSTIVTLSLIALYFLQGGGDF
jgi:hypothetical protein